jgi:aldehyde dehydrogenase (NAD+)
MRPISENVEAFMAPASQSIFYEPLGVVAIYGSWNVPLSVTIKPMITAISAGNCCFVKPSEMSPNTAVMIKKLIDTYLDTKAIACINGGPELGKKMNSQRFDLICFTGSTQVGKIVAVEAAKNLVPCILELGGKCPFIVDIDADINTAATKCMSAKTLNSGQVCIAPDYVLVHEKVLKKFVEKCQEKLKDFFGDPSKLSPFQGMMVNKFHTERIQRVIATSGGKIVCGGKVNVEGRHVEPTIILEPSKDSELMREEIFGCVLPVFPFDNIKNAVNYINTKEKPLTVYYFGHTNTTYVAQTTSSGHFVANEILFQFITSY